MNGTTARAASRPWHSSQAFSNWLKQTASWIEAHDDHAEYHLNLLGQVAHALDDDAGISLPEQDGLAQKLERYRYQHLNEHGSSLTDADQALVDLLDQTANRLTGRPARPPRTTRHAIGDLRLETSAVQKAIRFLGSEVPLNTVADQAMALTAAHFPGFESPLSDCMPATAPPRRMLLYAPIYVSNECVNYCTYCGFRYPHRTGRAHLGIEQVVAQAQLLRDRGFRHLLVLSGDFPAKNKTAYFQELIARLIAIGIVPAIEIAAQTTHGYASLVAAGLRWFSLYQETYDTIRYARYHPRGPKASFHWRLEAHDRAAEAGIERLGLGILLGLADPVSDLRAMMRHAVYLTNRFPDRTIAFSLPRIHEAPDHFQVAYPVSDETLIRFYCVLRIAFPDAELVLSTREPAALRDRLARICITQMSAGSSTAPGGYTRIEGPACATEPRPGQTETLVGEQFPVSDHRSPAEVVQWLIREGFQVLSRPDQDWQA